MDRKSSKYLSEVHFMERDERGFWELRGVHEGGRVMLEERYSSEKKEKTGAEEAEKIIEKCRNDLKTELDLSGMELNEIPDSVFQLTSIRTLILFNNNLTTIPEKISQLTNLNTLSLNGNKFTEIPSSIGNIRSLKELWMCDNQITHLPIELKKLKKLFVLGIERNRILEIPKWLAEIPKLSALFADINEIRTIPKELASRHWDALLFSSNPIEFIPKEIGDLKDITFLSFFGCKCIPSSVLEDGTPSILNYLQKGDAPH